MYYKIIKNNEIVDVVDHLRYVRRNPRNGSILSCGSKKGPGILSYDGSTIYKIDDILDGDYDAVTMKEIDAAEYRRLRDLFDGIERVEPAQPEEPPVVEEVPEEPTQEPIPETDTPFVEEEPVEELREPMSIAEIREKVAWLEETVRKLIEKKKPRNDV